MTFPVEKPYCGTTKVYLALSSGYYVPTKVWNAHGHGYTAPIATSIARRCEVTVLATAPDVIETIQGGPTRDVPFDQSRSRGQACHLRHTLHCGEVWLPHYLAGTPVKPKSVGSSEELLRAAESSSSCSKGISTASVTRHDVSPPVKYYVGLPVVRPAPGAISRVSPVIAGSRWAPAAECWHLDKKDRFIQIAIRTLNVYFGR
ncbi:uncharacterized protein BJ212DRAFT_1295623 [Suillus subaureus]|uniref:Uncharacterized protein n=1 Tax=Suillus subaureus TaxID=48587 RepID=A0A9P7EK69_9AGAM|nr:uncharacterized protein BJ212DRAFT_1295623 [Suillus subaureus]KAG1824466.1 hypothetical protein BJ212DRAFT_1295623 [Suillus subaureus]